MKNIGIKEVEATIEKAKSYIFSNQYSDGRWQGTIYYNAYPTAVMLILNKMAKISTPEWEKKALEWIEENQRSDGSWFLLDKMQSNHPHLKEHDIENMLEVKASTVRNTVACLLALELFDGNKEKISQAKLYLKDIDKSLIDPFTIIFLAYFDRWSWDDLKIPPIEVLLLPNNSKFGINRVIPAWIRDAAIGALVYKTYQEKKHLWSPLRKLAIRKGIKLLLNNQLSNGSWFGTFQPTVYPLLALKEYGYSNSDDCIKKAYAFLDSRKDQSKGYVHRFNLPVWDTGLTLLSLLADGSKRKSKIRNACNFLFKAQTNEFIWGFAPEVTLYPDSDDTSVSMRALIEAGYPKEHFSKTSEWLLKMQNSDGGWPAFIKNQAKKKKGTLPTTVEDSLVILRDPSVADITGHVVSALGTIGYTLKNTQIAKAIDFLLSDQLECGAWYGRWGLCYLYGTTRVLNGLLAVKFDMGNPKVQKAIQWLIECQNNDGGWGEHYISYFRESHAGTGYSTPCQTGWVVETLVKTVGINHDSVERGIRYLLKNQLKNGNWASPATVGALEIYENTNYSSIFPLLGLGTYYKYRTKHEE